MVNFRVMVALLERSAAELLRNGGQQMPSHDWLGPGFSTTRSNRSARLFQSRGEQSLEWLQNEQVVDFLRHVSGNSYSCHIAYSAIGYHIDRSRPCCCRCVGLYFGRGSPWPRTDKSGPGAFMITMWRWVFHKPNSKYIQSCVAYNS